jgi:hypothetical protein
MLLLYLTCFPFLQRKQNDFICYLSTCLCLSVWTSEAPYFDFWTGWPIFMKFGKDVRGHHKVLIVNILWSVITSLVLTNLDTNAIYNRVLKECILIDLGKIRNSCQGNICREQRSKMAAAWIVNLTFDSMTIIIEMLEWGVRNSEWAQGFNVPTHYARNTVYKLPITFVAKVRTFEAVSDKSVLIHLPENRLCPRSSNSGNIFYMEKYVICHYTIT